MHYRWVDEKPHDFPLVDLKELLWNGEVWHQWKVCNLRWRPITEEIHHIGQGGCG